MLNDKVLFKDSRADIVASYPTRETPQLVVASSATVASSSFIALARVTSEIERGRLLDSCAVPAATRRDCLQSVT